MKNSPIKVTLMVMMTMVFALIANDALAVPVPAVGSFFYEVYDVVVVKMLQGSAGFVIGCVAVLVGCGEIIMSKILPGVAAVVGGACLVKADAIVVSLGATLS
jgi:hypothetical protein